LNQCVTIRLGLQIPSFSYGTSVAELFPAVRAQAQGLRPPASTLSW
jgi:hypothetical protein